MKGEAIFLKKLTSGLKNDTMNLVDFPVSHRKSKNLYFDGLFLSIAYKFSAEKGQKSYLSWHWGVIQTLKENWRFVFKKWHKEFGEFYRKQWKVWKFALWWATFLESV